MVSAAEGTVFHNRLTHSLKVAQLARRLAEHLVIAQPAYAEAWGGLDPEVVEAAALAHDLGHPPFGHVAETTLNALVQQADHSRVTQSADQSSTPAGELLAFSGDSDGFEGNAQSLRIVDWLSAHRQPGRGLDLTRATLRAIMKYPRARDLTVPLDHRRYKKFSVYRSERDILNWAYGNPATAKPTLETEIMDYADDVAYSVHDLEDFVRAGLIPLARLTQPRELDRFIKHWLRDRPEMADALEDPTVTRINSALQMIDTGHDYLGTYEDRAALRTRTSGLINRYLPAARIAEPGSPRPLQRDEELDFEMKFFQRLVWYYVIQNPALATQQDGQRRLISNLFEAFMAATEPRKSDGRPTQRYVLPPGLQQDLDKVMVLEEPDRFLGRLRLASDAICSFTDAEAITMHNRLIGVAPGSVTDIVLH